MFVNLFSFQRKMMQNSMKKSILAFFIFIFSISVVFATEVPMGVAVLRGLDKVTGRTSTFSIPVGQVGQFGKTFIVPEACYTHPPEEFPENSAFLYVFEKSLKGENVELFKGWMFSSEPALSSMEHPVYDIWLIECREGKTQGEQKNKPVTQEPLKEEKVEQTDLPDEKPIQTTKSASELTPSQVEMEEL